jgi:ankyrin repeat protein
MSDQFAAIPNDVVILPASYNTNSSTSEKNAKLIMLCCQNRKDCIHRKYIQTNGLQTLTAEQTCNGLGWKDFTIQHGRDIWNHTAFHLAAEWAPDEFAIPLMQCFLDQRPRQCQFTDPPIPSTYHDKCRSPALHKRVPDILNVKNIAGETFMHVLARRWRTLVFPPHMTAALFCSSVVREGFDLSLHDSFGRTFFSWLVDSMRHSWPRIEADITLRSFSWMLSDLLVESGLSRDALAFVGGILQGTEMSIIVEHMQQSYDITHNHRYGDPLVNREDKNLYRDRGAGINAYDEYGRTDLMALINLLQDPASNESGAPTLDRINTCISQGPDLNLLDRSGNTALHYAVRAGFPRVVELLIDSGININARNLQGVSAMELAVAQYKKVARPSSKDLSVAYARVQEVLIRLFESATRRGRSRGPGGNSNASVVS